MATSSPPSPLIRYLRVQADFEVEMRRVLETAYAAAEDHLRQLEGNQIGTSIRRAQIRQAQAAINKELSKLYANVGDVIRSNRAKAAAAAVQSNMDPFVKLFEQAGMDAQQIDSMIRSQQATAARGVENAVSRVTLTERPLSERVYDSRVMVSGQLNNIINSAIARGASYKELADAVRPFINPNVRGGVNYAAERLGRTELNNAFHGTQVQDAIKSPFVQACRWHLSGSHPRPDQCNEYAEGGDQEDGLWSPENVPGKPHPNCLCYLTSETPSREAFLQSFQRGDYNDYLVENGSTPVPTGRSGR